MPSTHQVTSPVVIRAGDTPTFHLCETKVPTRRSSTCQQTRPAGAWTVTVPADRAADDFARQVLYISTGTARRHVPPTRRTGAPRSRGGRARRRRSSTSTRARKSADDGGGDPPPPTPESIRGSYGDLTDADADAIAAGKIHAASTVIARSILPQYRDLCLTSTFLAAVMNIGRDAAARHLPALRAHLDAHPDDDSRYAKAVPVDIAITYLSKPAHLKFLIGVAVWQDRHDADGHPVALSVAALCRRTQIGYRSGERAAHDLEAAGHLTKSTTVVYVASHAREHEAHVMRLSPAFAARRRQIAAAHRAEAVARREALDAARLDRLAPVEQEAVGTLVTILSAPDRERPVTSAGQVLHLLDEFARSFARVRGRTGRTPAPSHVLAQLAAATAAGEPISLRRAYAKAVGGTRARTVIARPRTADQPIRYEPVGVAA